MSEQHSAVKKKQGWGNSCQMRLLKKKKSRSIDIFMSPIKCHCELKVECLKKKKKQYQFLYNLMNVLPLFPGNHMKKVIALCMKIPWQLLYCSFNLE